MNSLDTEDEFVCTVAKVVNIPNELDRMLCENNSQTNDTVLSKKTKLIFLSTVGLNVSRLKHYGQSVNSYKCG